MNIFELWQSAYFQPDTEVLVVDDEDDVYEITGVDVESHEDYDIVIIRVIANKRIPITYDSMDQLRENIRIVRETNERDR